jgi:high-affinity Fe2+/Pb2+ permease
MVFFLGTRSFGTRTTMVTAVALGLIAVLLVLAGWWQHWRTSRRAPQAT